MVDNDINIGYPPEIIKGRTLFKDLESLAFAAQMIVSYNDGGAQTEDSDWSEPTERAYVIPPDRIFAIYPVTRLGTKKLHSDGEVTVYENKIVCADATYNHFDRVSVKLAASNFGGIGNITVFPLMFEFMVLVTDGTITHLYKVSRNTGPVTIQLPEDMTGEQTVTAPTMYLELIFYDTDYGITEGFVLDDTNKTLYYAWMQPAIIWCDVVNTLDTGILGGIGFLANIGLSSLFDRIIPMLTDHAQLQVAAKVAKIPIEVIATSLGVAICLGAYYNWIEVDKFISKGGIGRLIQAVLNPVGVGGTLVAMGTGLINNSWANLFSKAAGGVSTWMTTQAMLQIVDDIQLEVSA